MQRVVDAGDTSTAARTYRFGFVLQQVLGWVAAYQNFRRYVEQDSTVAPVWTEVTHIKPGGLLERLPLVPRRVTGTVRGLLQVHEGLGDLPFIGGASSHGYGYDAVLFNGHALCLTARRFLKRVPAIVATDVTPLQLDAMAEYYDRPPMRDTPFTRYKHRAYTDVFRSARLLAPWSAWTGQSLVRDYGVPEERIVVVPPGVDVERWTPAEPGVRLASLERSGGLPRILFVGGHFQRKGGDLLLDWFLHKGRGRCELHIVTRTPPELPEPVPGLHIYTGLEANDPRLMDLYREAHLFVLPTLADCFGVASIEAMAMGLPVITTAVGGVPEIVDNGVQGYIVAPNDGHALAERLELLVADEAKRLAMGEAARAKVLQRFDARANAQTMIALMKHLADN